MSIKTLLIVCLLTGFLCACAAEDHNQSTPSLDVPILPNMISYDPDTNCQIRTEFSFDSLETINVPLVDEQILTQEESSLPKDQPPRFAYSIPVTIYPGVHGSWHSLEDNIQIWRIKVVSPGALSLNFGFTKYKMPSGGCLFLYSPDYITILGPFSDKDNADHGQLWTPVINGEEAIIEVTLPKSATAALKLEIGFVNHGYK